MFYQFFNKFKKNPWEKITANINLKDSEHPGKKDINRYNNLF